MNLRVCALFVACAATVFSGNAMSADDVFSALGNVVPTERSSAIAAASTQNFYDNDFGRQLARLLVEELEVVEPITQLLEGGYHFSCIYIPELPGVETLSFLYGEKCADLNELELMFKKCGFTCEWVGSEARPILKLSKDAFFAQIAPHVFLLAQNEAPVADYFSLQQTELGMSEEGGRKLQLVMEKSFFYADLPTKELLAELTIEGKNLAGRIVVVDQEPESILKCIAARGLLLKSISEHAPAVATALEKAIVFKADASDLRIQVDLSIDTIEATLPLILGEAQ